MELVLYYSTGDARMKKQEMMMKSVLVRMGVKIRNVAPDQVLEAGSIRNAGNRRKTA